jgi:glycosyltransferase involved in cell wall biosynthesis
VCVVTGELYGWNNRGDAASAVLAIAQLMSKLGDTVTLLWVPARSELESHDYEIEKVRTSLFERYLIRLVVVSSSPQLFANLYRSDQASLAVYHHLQNNEYDAVYFALEGGLGHFTMTAKQTGMLRQRPALIVVAHEPLLWRCEANRQFVETKADIITDHMERTSVALCDHLVACTQDLIDWMKRDGWTLPESLSILPGMLPSVWRTSGRSAEKARKRTEPDEIVFIGGPDLRYGLNLFCDAVDSLARNLASAEITITMIGGFGLLAGEHTGGMVLRRARKWPFRLRILPRLSEEAAVEYLRSRNCLVVIPNLAAQIPQALAVCLDAQVPFIATNVGGTAEMILLEAASSVLCEPKAGALAAKIAAVIEAGPAAAVSASNNHEGKERLWKEAHAKYAHRVVQSEPKTKKSKQPLVSIVLAHYDRPHYLQQAVESVRGQDYPNIELLLVDDGSRMPESLRVLDELEPEFKKRNWRILREENRFLGAARNTAIRAARGERILFLDDDNALFPSAVSDLVQAMDWSGADICTTFAKLLHEPFVPADTSQGFIQYYPLGGPPDLAMFQDPYGDANALFRREVFDRIGYLNEQRGFSASDWEFFLRADLAGLKIAVVPEALYWYRSDPGSMHLSSNWYECRVPIIEVFRKHKFKGLKLFHDLAVSQNTEEKPVALWNLDFSPSNAILARLAGVDPLSDEACDILAEAAAAEGRADTAVMLLGQARRPDFKERLAARLSTHSFAERALTEIGADFFHEELIGHDALRRASVIGTTGGLRYTEKPAHIYVEARGENASIIVLPGICPKGTVAVTGWVFLDEVNSSPGDFLLTLTESSVDPIKAVYEQAKREGSSGWLRVSRARDPLAAEARLAAPSERSLSVVMATRSVTNGVKIIGAFSDLKIIRALGAEIMSRPRFSPPPQRLRARELDSAEFARAKLVTPYPSGLPLVLYPPKGEGLFLRPSAQGSVAAVISHSFPPLARKIIASVEIAHEDAGPFEFAIALAAVDQKVDWKRGEPTGVVAFSGWKRIEEKFKLQEVIVEIRERTKAHLSIYLAIRLPKGSRPSPANAFWRRIVFVWDDD